MSTSPAAPYSQRRVKSVTITETKCECRVFLFRPKHGESLDTTQPKKGLIYLTEMQDEALSLRFGIIDLPFRDDNLLQTFGKFECHVELEDGRRVSGAIGSATGTGDCMEICVLGWSKPVAIEETQRGQ